MTTETKAKLKSTGEVFDIVKCQINVDGEITDVCLNVPDGEIFGWYPIDAIEMVEVEIKPSTVDATKAIHFYDPEREVMTIQNLSFEKAKKIKEIINESF